MRVFPRKRLADYALKGLRAGDRQIAEKIAAYLVLEGKTSEVNSLARDILQLQTDKFGLVEVTAVSAHQLDEDSRRQIEGMVRRTHPQAKKIIINERVDEGVIGGIRLEFANELLNNTVDARLNNLREKIKS